MVAGAIGNTVTEYALLRVYSDEREDHIATETTYLGGRIYSRNVAVERKREFDSALKSWDPNAHPENAAHYIMHRDVTYTEWVVENP